MSGYTIHLGLMPEHSQANFTDLDGAVGTVLKARRFYMTGDCLSVRAEPSDTDPSLHVTINYGVAVDWEMVERERRMLDSLIYGYGYRVMDYAFVTDRDDWSRDCRTWLLTERHTTFR